MTRRQSLVREIASRLATGAWTAEEAKTFSTLRALSPDALAGLVAEARAIRAMVVESTSRLDVSDPVRRRNGALGLLAEVAAEARAARDFGPAVQALRTLLDYRDDVPLVPAPFTTWRDLVTWYRANEAQLASLAAAEAPSTEPSATPALPEKGLDS